MHLNRQLMMRKTTHMGGHPAQAGCLWILANHEGISQRELAGHLHLAAATVTSMLQRMERQGLIERWTDETDQRLTRIRLTDAGRELNEGLAVAMAEAITAATSPLTEEDREELARLLGLLADNTAREMERMEG
jgi:DNA-binding MarR family transcriptional regulator